MISREQKRNGKKVDLRAKKPLKRYSIERNDIDSYQKYNKSIIKITPKKRCRAVEIIDLTTRPNSNFASSMNSFGSKSRSNEKIKNTAILRQCDS